MSPDSKTILTTPSTPPTRPSATRPTLSRKTLRLLPAAGRNDVRLATKRPSHDHHMKRSAKQCAPVPGGAAIFQRLYTRLGCRGRPPRFEVEFYPYANLMHTIRVHEETAYVRLSD